MLKRSIGFLSKAKVAQRTSLIGLRTGTQLFNNLSKASFSSVWQANVSQQFKNINYFKKCTFASQPSHQKLAMPALSPTMEQGNIVKWNFKEGDKIGAGDQICEIETDKATLGFDMQDDGYIAKILFKDGTKGVKVGTPIVILVDSEADVKAFADYKGESSEGQDAGKQGEEQKPKEASGDSKGKDEKTKEQPKPEVKTEPQQQQKDQQQDKSKKTETKGGEKEPQHVGHGKGVPRTNVRIKFTHGKREEGQGGQEGQAAGHGERVSASPYARKLAAEKGIDLSQVEGSGPNGRVLAHDVESYTPKQKAAPIPEKPAEKSQPQKEKPKSQPAAAAPSNPYTDAPVQESRAELAKKVSTSKTTIPHYYLKSEVFTEKANEIIAELNKDTKTPISLSDIIVKAASLACIEVPEANSQWNGQSIRKFKNVDVTVAINTGSETFGPVIQGADTKGLSEIAKLTKQFTEKANNNQLKPEELGDGTFTVINLSPYGLSRFAPIVVPPQSCALGVGKIGKKVVPAGEGYKEVGAFEVILSCDHRVVDGAVGARWLQVFKNYVEKPNTMLL